MAQIAVTREIRALQVSTGQLYSHRLPEEAAPEADEHGIEADGGGGGQGEAGPGGGGGLGHGRDPIDVDSQRRTVTTFVEYANLRARGDVATSDSEESLLRFSLNNSDAQRDEDPKHPAIRIAKKFIQYAQVWEAAVEGDKDVQEVANSVVDDCRAVREEGTDDPGPPQVEVAYRHLAEVFRRLFTWEEVRNGKLHLVATV